MLNGKDSSSVTEQEVSDLYFEVQHFVPVKFESNMIFAVIH